MEITGVHINYFFVCKRELWFFANEIRMEHESELVEEGRFIHETSYSRRSKKFKELEIGPVKIDYFDPKHKIIYEVKKSNKIEKAHIWQLKYYIYLLKEVGIEGVKGILEYPKLKKRKLIVFKDEDSQKIKKLLKVIEALIRRPKPPPAEKKPYCRSCSYYEFCFITENPQQ